jgi:succinate dehydrogenase/fumarate reductase-like Fe-S protein
MFTHFLTLKVIKDLIGDLTTLYKQYESIKPWLETAQTGEEKNRNKSNPKRQGKTRWVL